MSANNPHFTHRQRSAYQLGHLLRNLPANVDLTVGDNRKDMRLRLEAAARHAENYSETLLDGLASLGRVMWSAAENKDWPLEQSDVARIGTLISDLAVQLQFLDEFRTNASDRIAEADQEARK